MARLSPKLEALCDMSVSYNHGRRGYWNEPTLSVGRAKAICEAGRIATGLKGVSKVNKALTLEQAHTILSRAGSATESDDEPMHFLAAKNVLREFGRFYEKPEGGLCGQQP